MGTHIDIIFPRNTEMSVNDINGCLNKIFSGADNLWHIEKVKENGCEPAYLAGEGPNGYDISVYENVIYLGQIKRFWQLYDPGSCDAINLQRTIQLIVSELSGEVPFIAVAGGMGDSDIALDMAYYEASSFKDITSSLRNALGNPAKSWDELKKDEYVWLLNEIKEQTENQDK